MSAMSSSTAGLEALMKDTSAKRAALNTVGQSFATGFGGGVVTVLAPGANAKGAVIRTAHLVGFGTSIRLYVDTAAPANQTDSSKRCLGWSTSGAVFSFYEPIFVQVGMGIYIASGSADSVYSVTFEVLP